MGGLAAVLVVLLAVGGGVAYQRRQGRADDAAARALADRVAAAVRTGKVGDLPFGDGTDAATRQREVSAAVRSLRAGTATTRVASLTRDGDAASAGIAVRRTLPGGAVWAYDLPLTLSKSNGWRVPATQRLVHPAVGPGQVLRLTRTQPDRAGILGGGDSPIVTPQAVIDVGIQPSRAKGSAAALAGQVAGIVAVDGAQLAARVKAAAPDAFVDVITLRRSDYTAVRDRLRPLPGVVFRERQQPLAPTKEFARALLGGVGPVTADLVKQGKGRYLAGDVAGTSGLQLRYDQQLAGTAGLTVTVAEAKSAGEPGAEPLFAVAAKPGKALRTTLDAKTQLAADAALAGLTQPAALVAVDVRTGAVLAVANSPETGLNRALVGRYPPGSTFKVVTTLALLGKGLRTTDSVQCPPTATVDGRSFRNYESEKFGAVPFRTDFVKSCNTAFVGLSARLSNDDLSTTAKQLGIGATWSLGTDAFTGSVPVNTSAVDRAAAAFGQARNEVSPLAVTVATASVARGGYLPPTLVLGDGKGPAPQQLPPGPVGALRSLMRGVVTSGTGVALRSVPGGPVAAKTGTAEFGAQSPPQTRAWITGWQGNVAFTAFVEEGKSGGTVAGPVAAKFLTLLARG